MFLRNFQEFILTTIPHSADIDTLQTQFYETVAKQMERKHRKPLFEVPRAFDDAGLLRAGQTNTVPLTIAQAGAKNRPTPKPRPASFAGSASDHGSAAATHTAPQQQQPKDRHPQGTNGAPPHQQDSQPQSVEGSEDENGGGDADFDGPEPPLQLTGAGSTAPSEGSTTTARADGVETMRQQQKKKMFSFSKLPRPPPNPPSSSSSTDPSPAASPPPQDASLPPTSEPAAASESQPAGAQSSSPSPPQTGATSEPQTPPRTRAATFTASPTRPPDASSPSMPAPTPLPRPYVAPGGRRALNARATQALSSIKGHIPMPSRQALNAIASKIPVPHLASKVPDRVCLAWFAWRYSAAEMAHQIALINFDLFNAVDPVEWTIEPFCWEIEELNRWTHRLTRWVVYEIIGPERVQERAQAYEILVDVAECLQKLNDYNGMVVVLNALQVSSVARLKNTLKLVNPVSLDKLNVLSSLVKVDDRYKDLRQLIRLTPLPGVPYPGIYVKELIYIRTGIPSFLDKQKTIINFTKVDSLTRCLKEMIRFRESQYHLEVFPDIQDYLRNWPINYNHDALFQLSLQREPREK